MAEPVEEMALDEAPGDTGEAEATVATDPVPEPATSEPVAQDSLPELEAAFGDTPLSAIERLSIPAELSPQIRRRDRLLTAAWAASFAILAALGVAGYTERNQLMRQWPASKRVYATLGLAPIANSAGSGLVGNGRVVEGEGGDGKTTDMRDGTGQRPAETSPR